MEIKLALILSVMMFIMCLICIGLSVFYTFRIEKAYNKTLNGRKTN